MFTYLLRDSRHIARAGFVTAALSIERFRNASSCEARRQLECAPTFLACLSFVLAVLPWKLHRRLEAVSVFLAGAWSLGAPKLHFSWGALVSFSAGLPE